MGMSNFFFVAFKKKHNYEKPQISLANKNKYMNIPTFLVQMQDCLHSVWLLEHWRAQNVNRVLFKKSAKISNSW